MNTSAGTGHSWVKGWGQVTSNQPQTTGFHSRVTGGVQVVLVRNLGKVVWLCAKPAHVFPTGVAKHLGGDWGRCNPKSLIHHLNVVVHGVSAVSELEGGGGCSNKADLVHNLSTARLSLTLGVRDPLSIFSNPSASTQSATPEGAPHHTSSTPTSPPPPPHPSLPTSLHQLLGH